MLFDFFLVRHFHGYYWDYLLHLPVPIWAKRKVKFRFFGQDNTSPNSQIGDRADEQVSKHGLSALSFCLNKIVFPTYRKNIR